MISMKNVTAKLLSSLSFERLQYLQLWMRLVSSVNYAEVKCVKIRKRKRRQKTSNEGIEIAHHSSPQRRNQANKLKTLCPEDLFITLEQRRKKGGAELPGGARSNVLFRNCVGVVNYKLSGHEVFPCELEDCTENTEVDNYDESMQKPIKNVVEKGCEKPSLHLKTKNNNNEMPKKGGKVGAMTIKKCQKIDSHKKLVTSELALQKESFVQSLISYVDACIDCGFLNHGMKALVLYREHSKRSGSNRCSDVLDARVFELLLHGYATRRNISKVEELMRMMTEDCIKHTAQCYAACFECVARELDECRNNMKTQLNCDNVETSAKKKIREWAFEMIHKGLSLNDLFTKTCLLSDQKNMVMAAVMNIHPNFKVVFPPCPEFGYACKLLDCIKQFDSIGYHSPVSGLVDSEQLKMFSSEQLQNEIKGYLDIKSIEHRQEPNELVIYRREKLAKCKKEWYQVILNVLIRDFQTLHHNCQAGVLTHRFMSIYPFLASVKVEEIVELVLQEIQKLAEESETYSSTTNQLYRVLGSQVFERYQVGWKKRNGIFDKMKDLHGKYCEWFSNPDKVIIFDKTITCTRQAWQSLVYAHLGKELSLSFVEKNWPTNVQIGIGKYLYGIILNEIMIDVNILKQIKEKSHQLPAFYSIFRPQKKGKIIKNEVKPHPVLARLFRGAASDTLKFPTRCMPMLCPPVPWTAAMSGAYMATRTDVIRLQQGALQWKHLLNCPPQQLYPAFDSLNQLGSVPWKINKPVLDVIINVFNSGGSSQLDIPLSPSSFSFSMTNPVLVVSPPKPNNSSLNQVKNLNGIWQSEKNRFERYKLCSQRKKAEAYSLWRVMLYRLSIANHLRDRIFWLPHNMDFRGRVYPCPPHLNHLGSDVARSLLCFAKGQPLGPRGLTWLKLHLVNLTGLKKRNSMKERLEFAEEVMAKVIDSAEKPITGDMWWAKSDEPLQTLAVCMEINAALKAEEGPENYVSHFPVHQDGSCNGLQHYAALGRDSIGASSVSMTPSEYPQDVYTVVAAKVEKEREADAKLGIVVAQKLKGFVCRKVIKQTVMTTVYGVTRFGARLQIAHQLRDNDEFPKEHVWCASLYLVGKTFSCLREMFTSTKEIQDWFTDCAQHISQVCGQCVEWVTPLGLPVVQPYQYVIGSKKNGRSDLFSRGLVKVPLGYHCRPNVMKQKNAFPPNFIHSMDSCHMMLTSLWCERKGITFVSVHDCYWTHPSKVEIMNRICREQFFSLHSQPILEDLSAFFIKNYSYLEEDLDKGGKIMDTSKRKLNPILAQVPKKGDFDLKNVLDSVYFFS